MIDDRIEICVPDQKGKFETWIRERGGVKVWKNINLSNSNAGNMYMPAKNKEGQENLNPPHWSYRFDKVITDLSQFRFTKEMKEVKRFRVAIRRGSQGFSFKLTDCSTVKLRKVCSQIQDQYKVAPAYRFDYDTQEAVIEIPIWED